MNADELKVRTGYAGKSQQWQYGFDLACREKQAEIDALKAQNAELLAAQQWRPIESAPKDGRAIVVLDTQNAMFVVYWHPHHRNTGDFRTFDKCCKRLAPEMLLGWTALSVPDYDGLEAIAKATGEKS